MKLRKVFFWVGGRVWGSDIVFLILRSFHEGNEDKIDRLHVGSGSFSPDAPRP